MSNVSPTVLSPISRSPRKRITIGPLLPDKRNYQLSPNNKSLHSLLDRRDRSMSSGLKLKKLNDLRLSHLKHEEEVLCKRIQSRIEKKTAIKKIRGTLGIKLPKIYIKTSTVSEIWDKAQNIFNIKQKTRAINKISSWWKKLSINRKIQQINIRLHVAASLIQKYWKKYQILKSESVKNESILNAVITIQKHYRGFKVRNKYKLIFLKIRMDRIFNFFEKEKSALRAKAATSIENIWARYNARIAFEVKLKENPVKERNNSMFINSNEERSPQSPAALKPKIIQRKNGRHYTYPKKSYAIKITSDSRNTSP